MRILTCTCCGTEITAPQFFEGKAYGYTCIKKVAPSQPKSKTVYTLADSYELATYPNSMLKKIIVQVDGKKYAARQQLGSVGYVGVELLANGDCLINLKIWSK